MGWTNRKANRIAGEEGASAVEFAIVMIVMFLVLFGTIQFGFAFHRSQALEAAAREGARLASTGATDAAITDRVRRAASMFTPTDIQVTLSTQDGAGNPVASTDPRCVTAPPGSYVVVTATVAPNQKYAISIPLWGNRTITYQARGVFRCE